MWDKWKKKIRNFIWKEVEEDHSGEKGNYQQPRKNKPIQAKMVYQYPKQKNLRFPVIPDERPKENQSVDVPAYKRRNMHKKPSENEQQKEQISNNVFNQNREQISDRKVYKKDESRPFKPSRVPSPIYGFQERKKEKDVQEVPAFLRKQPSNKSETESKMNEDIEKDQLKVEEEKVKVPLEIVRTEEREVEEKEIKEEKNHKSDQIDAKTNEDKKQPTSTHLTSVHSDKKVVSNTKGKKE